MNIGNRNITNETTKEKLSEILRNSPEGKKVIDRRRNYVAEIDELAKNIKVTLGDKSYGVKDIIVAKSSNSINIEKMIQGIEPGSCSISEAGDFVDIGYILTTEGSEYLFKMLECNNDESIEFYTTYHNDDKITASIFISKRNSPEQPREIKCQLSALEEAFFRGMIKCYWYNKCYCTIIEWMEEEIELRDVNEPYTVIKERM